MFRERWNIKKALWKFSRESRFLGGERPLQLFISSVMNEELTWARETTIDYFSKIPGYIPWAFEKTPASSEDVREGYLNKVRESDFVIWLIGSTTTDPVKLEIREALSTERRILAFKFPSDNRDNDTQNLIQEIGQRVKWVEVANKQELLDAFEKSISDEIIRALRKQPGLGRIARFEEMRRTSKGRCLARWQATGATLDIAISLYNDPAIGMPPNSLAQKPLVILIGDFGAGKSLIAERMYQIGIDKAMLDSSAPIPVFLMAQQVSDNLFEKVIELSEGLGNPKRQGALIIIDGADEAGISASSQLLEMARVLSQAWPKTSVLITSRPLPVYTAAEESIIVPGLNTSDVQKIVSKVVGYELTPGMMRGLPKPISDAIARPLFALLWGNYLRRQGDKTIKTTGELISYLVDSSIRLTDDEVAESIELLEKLAASSIDRGGAYIHWGEIGTREDVDNLLESRLVVRNEDLIGFPLPILTQWFAAQGLVKGEPDILDIVKDKIRLDRWRYPLIILVSTYSHEQVTRVLTPIVECNPGFAAEIVNEAIAQYGLAEGITLPPARECAERVRETLQIWINGIGNVSSYIAPITVDGRLETTGVNIYNSYLMIAWHKGEQGLNDIIELPLGAFPSNQGWYIARSAQVGPQPGWAWRWSLEELVQRLDKLLGSYAFMVAGGHMYREKMWQIGLDVFNYGSLYPYPLPLDDLDERVTQVIRKLGGGDLTNLNELKNLILKMRGEGMTIMESPWPGPDLELQGGGWIWDPYSEDQILNRARKVYAACLEEYENLVNVFFFKFKPRLMTAALLPVKIIGEIHFSDSAFSKKSPGINWYFEPLPNGSQNSVQISFGNRERIMDVHDLYEKNRMMRPEAAEWLSAFTSGGILDIFHVNPVTKLVYEWLKNDLKRVNWAK